MLCLYINLDREPARRTFVERNFAEFAPAHWSLRRIPAVDGRADPDAARDLKISAAELACIRSHVAALEAACAEPGHVMICEDDVLFGPRSFVLIDAMVGGAVEKPWDILFAEAGFGDPRLMIDLFLRYRQLSGAQQAQLIALPTHTYYGATAYIVHEKAKARLLDLVRALPLSAAYDDLLKRLIVGKDIAANLIFPFATSISQHAEASGIQSGGHLALDHVRNAFRRMMWAGGPPLPFNLAAAAAAVEDERTGQFADVLRLMLAPRS